MGGLRGEGRGRAGVTSVRVHFGRRDLFGGLGERLEVYYSVVG